MNFFQQLSDLTGGKADLTLRIMQKGDSITVNVMPGNSNNSFEPILATGTAAELDEAFFSQLMPEVKEVAGLITNIAEVKESVKKKAEEKAKPAAAAPAKEKDNKKQEPKKRKSKEPAVIAQDIFSQTGGSADENEEAVDHEPDNDQQEEEQTSDDE